MTEQPGPVARAALALTDWTERWVPDAFIFALIATRPRHRRRAGRRRPSTLLQTVDAWGRGFWDLIPFTLQMALVIITGHVLATSPPMGRADPRDRRRGRARRAARWRWSPSSRSRASWFNWGFSLVFSAVLRDRDRAARRRRRLSRAGGGEHARPRQHLGAGPQRIGGAADGDARRAAAADPRHRRARRPGRRRPHPVPPHDLSLAELRRRSRSRSSSSSAVMWLRHAAGRARAKTAQRSRHRPRRTDESSNRRIRESISARRSGSNTRRS